MVLCSYVDNEDEVDFIPIDNQELVVIVSNDHPPTEKDSIDLIELDSYPFIGFSEKSGIRPLINNLFEKIDLKPNIICEVEEDNAIAGLVEINYGIAVVPRISSLKNYNIKVLPIVNPTHERFIYLATLKIKYLTPSVSLFKNFIVEKSKDKLLEHKKY
ncbi:LysR substrate-binding domain-containing protein [Clostridium sp.]|uniref:LysR substrate-binding domain-containing protein n=1 Tax=Clostridium sp. TaxID=1506 RepID=UPI003418F3D2